MADTAPTIPALKQRFIVTQTNILSQPLAPSRGWQASHDASERPIPPKVIDDALFQLNHALQQHCRRVHAPQATRAVAEQISDAYTAFADRRVGDGGAAGDPTADGAVGRDLDLLHGETIRNLPPNWASDKEAAAYPMEAKRYTEAVERLTELKNQREQLRIRVDKLKRVKATIDPLQTAEGGAGLQENLLTRNGQVEMELERMRILLARVTGRVGQLPNSAEGAVDSPLVDLSKARKRNVEEFLADPNVFPR